MLQLHEAILTAECTKCVVFSGPGVLTALLEVGIEAANARARALMSDTEGGLLPMVEEAADPNAPAAEGDGAATPANTEAPTPETAEP
jgi:ribosomal protein L12E/L44/L45/RPP1/RPP2